MGKPSEAAQKDRGCAGYGAGPTTDAAIQTAEAICTSWVAKSDEGLMLEFIKDGREVTVDIGASGKIEAVAFNVYD